jgi:hypothetical protein
MTNRQTDVLKFASNLATLELRSFANATEGWQEPEIQAFVTLKENTLLFWTGTICGCRKS